MKSDYPHAPTPMLTPSARCGTRRLPLSEVIEAAVTASLHCIEKHHHELQLDLPPAVLMVEADLDQLTQVFTNLLLNACKYTPDYGRIAIIARQSGNIVDVAIRDDGAGIPPELQPYIFDLSALGFRQADLSPGRLGTGLTLARAIMGMHGGTIEVRSAGNGNGSEFTVSLPLRGA